MNKFFSSAGMTIIALMVLMISGCTDSEPVSQPPGIFAPADTLISTSIGDILANPYMYENVQVTGIVNQTIDVSGYTYVELTDGSGSMWVAGYSTQLENGSQVTASGSLMMDFFSNTTGMTFDLIMFADTISDGNTSSSPHGSSTNEISDVNVTSVAGGTRIGEILADPASFSGKEVKVAAVVVKNMQLISENFLTIDDGTGTIKARSPNTFAVSVGNTVEILGIVNTDVDLGSGYQYEVLIQVIDLK